MRLSSAVIVFGVISSRTAFAQATPTASQLVERITQHAAAVVPASTVDTFKSGDVNAKVNGIAVTMMSTLDVLKRAVAKGDNFIITHEPTFFTSRDTSTVFDNENDAVLTEKRKYIADHKLIIWRFHDTPHRMKPEMIALGVTRALGWESRRRGTSEQVFDIAPTTLDALARTISKRLGANATRVMGDANARVSSVGLTEGFVGFPANRHVFQTGNVDVMVIGEDHEWEMIEYAKDAIEEGRMKGMIVVGHIASEQAGMQEVTHWLKTFITEVPIDFIPTKEPFRSLK